ncbi:DUF2778 domain-containing protein [Microbacteriaceae bacterium K1510]|nr:DUF2778 domain-containing protein [Microbacteriaceae bacterium K1510]
MATSANVRTVVAATVAAAAIAGAVTWIDGASMQQHTATGAASSPDMAQQMPSAPLATTTIAKTHDQVDKLEGLLTDPTLRLDTSSAWRPAGGLGILTMAPAAAPNYRTAALPMPAPIVAAVTPPPVETAEADDVPLPRAHPLSVATVPVAPKNAAPAVIATAPEAPDETKPSSGGFFGMFKRFFTPHEKQNATAVLASNPRTAIYDISARVVYMPGGETLEAHSGLGEWLDDPSSFHRKDRGVTPPATYKITLREKLFHGVKALRLTPVGDAKMYGRDGMLAHSYMLGPNGQSNGCVSFKDYDKFLAAFSSGEVDQLIVVPQLTTAYAQANSSS